MKVCARCHIPQLLDNFYLQESTKDGRKAYCKVCSGEYHKDWRSKQPKEPKLSIVKPPPEPNVICLTCRTHFYCPPYYLKRGGGKYCSPDCYHNRDSIRQTMPCLRCGSIFTFSPYEVLQNRRFCTTECAGKWRTEETQIRTEKKCSNCHVIKILDDFYLNKSSADQHTHECKECIDLRAKERRENFPDQVKAQKKKSHQKNRPNNLRKMTEYQKKNPHIHRIWCRDHPEAVYAQNAKRRARLAGAPYETITLEEIYLRDGGICQICHRRTLPPHKGKPRSPKTSTLDHIIPVSHPDFVHIGHVRINVRLAHFGCNASRNYRPGDAQYLLFG